MSNEIIVVHQVILLGSQLTSTKLFSLTVCK